MGQSKQHYTLTWQGLKVDVTYEPSYSKSMERIYGYALAHLEVQSAGRTPLPFTETGSRSRFLPASRSTVKAAPLPMCSTGWTGRQKTLMAGRAARPVLTG